MLPAVTASLAGADIACVIYVRSGDRLLARGGEIWNVPLEEMIRLRATLDDLAETAPWSVLILSLPDELLAGEPADDSGDAGTGDAGTGIDRDRIADVATLAAADAWRHMHSYGFVPGAAAAAAGCGRCSTATAARKATPAVDGRRGPPHAAPALGGTAPGATSSGGRADGR